MVVDDNNDDHSEAESQQRIDENSFSVVILISVCFYLILEIRGR